MKDYKLYLQLNDDQWPLEYIDHYRLIARAIVFNDEGYFYFVGENRDDDFGKVSYIETAGGGIEEGETPSQAIVRELCEELGAEVEIVCKIGVVSDYYNLIHRHNLNNYFLCKATSFGDKHLTREEIEALHLKTLKLTYEQAVKTYEKYSDSKLGRLLLARELPILKKAREILSDNK